MVLSNYNCVLRWPFQRMKKVALVVKGLWPRRPEQKVTHINCWRKLDSEPELNTSMRMWPSKHVGDNEDKRVAELLVQAVKKHVMYRSLYDEERLSCDTCEDHSPNKHDIVVAMGVWKPECIGLLYFLVCTGAISMRRANGSTVSEYPKE